MIGIQLNIQEITQGNQEAIDFFFCEGDLKKKNQSASVLSYTQGCITSVLTHIHMFLKLNYWIFSKKPGACDLSVTQLCSSHEAAVEGDTQKKQVTL